MEALKPKVAIDTSMLLAIGQYKKDIFGDITMMQGKTEFYVSKPVEMELDRVAGKNRTQQKRAIIARTLLSLNQARTIGTRTKSPDESLIELAGKGYIIATNDKAVRKKLKGFGHRIFYLNSRKITVSE